MVGHADGRGRLAKLKILSGKNVNPQGLSTGKILFTRNVFLSRQDFLTCKISHITLKQVKQDSSIKGRLFNESLTFGKKKYKDGQHKLASR